MIGQVGVDPVGVRLEYGQRVGIDLIQFLVGDAFPAQGPQELIRVDLRFSEHLTEI